MLMKFNEKAISLACPLGKVPSVARRKGAEGGVTINISFLSEAIHDILMARNETISFIADFSFDILKYVLEKKI